MKIFPEIQTRFCGDAHPELPRAELFVRPIGYGPGCMSAEEAEFVWSVVRMVKPARALETGCEGGLTTCAIARALEDNRAGALDTVEWSAEWRGRTAQMLAVHQLTGRVTLHGGDSRDFIARAAEPYQFALLDSCIATRLEEFDALMVRNLLAPGALVILHDTAPNHPARNGAPLFYDFIRGRDYDPRIRIVELPSPRGLTLIEVR